MTESTLERAYALARAGEVRDLAALEARLKAEGCHAVDVLLASRNVRSHLEAICAAAYRKGQP